MRLYAWHSLHDLKETVDIVLCRQARTQTQQMSAGYQDVILKSKYMMFRTSWVCHSAHLCCCWYCCSLAKHDYVVHMGTLIGRHCEYSIALGVIAHSSDCEAGGYRAWSSHMQHSHLRQAHSHLSVKKSGRQQPHASMLPSQAPEVEYLHMQQYTDEPYCCALMLRCDRSQSAYSQPNSKGCDMLQH